MAKPEWGRKITCTGCGNKFYDMQRSPAVCPSCGAENDPMQAFRPKRSAPKPAAQSETKPKQAKALVEDDEDDLDDVLPEIDDDDLGDDDLDDDVDDSLDDDEDDDLMEDTADLGEDDDDLDEVREHIETEDDVKE